MACSLRDVGPWHARLMARNLWSHLDFHGHAWNRANPAIKVRRTLHGRSIIDKPTQPQFSVRRYGGAAKREALSTIFRKYRDADQSVDMAEQGAREVRSITCGDLGSADEADAEMAALYLNACAAFSCPPSGDVLREIATRVLPRCDHALAAECILGMVGASRLLASSDKRDFYSLVARTPDAAAVLVAEGSSAACCAALTWITEYVPTQASGAAGSRGDVQVLRDRLTNVLFTKLAVSSSGAATVATTGSLALSEILSLVFSLIGERVVTAGPDRGADELPAASDGNANPADLLLEPPPDRFRFLAHQINENMSSLDPFEQAMSFMKPSCSALVPIILPTVAQSVDQLFPLEAAGLFYFLLASASKSPGYATSTEAIQATVLDVVDELAHRLFAMSDLVAADIDSTALVLGAIASHDFARLRYKKLPKSLLFHFQSRRADGGSEGIRKASSDRDREDEASSQFVVRCLAKIGLSL